MVEHPRGDDGVEALVLERQLLHVADLCIGDAAGSHELDHPLRLVDERDGRSQLALHPFGELALPAADLEHIPRLQLGENPKEDETRVLTLDGGPQTLTGPQVLLGRVLLPDGSGIVDGHDAFLATNTELPRRATNGRPIFAGRFATNGDIEIDALT